MRGQIESESSLFFFSFFSQSLLFISQGEKLPKKKPKTKTKQNTTLQTSSKEVFTQKTCDL